MKFIFFLIALCFITIPLTYADSRGSDYQTQTNQDGSTTITLGLPKYIFDTSLRSYEPFIFTDTGSFLQVESAYGSVKLNKSSCVFSYFSKGEIQKIGYDLYGNVISNVTNSELFKDHILAKVSNFGSGSWNYLDSINNETCSASWNGSELTAQKSNPGVGLLKYKYILNNGKWKTQLEATNLSSATNKLFGFDQILNLNRDTIKYGGQLRNLDNFNGETFDRSWLDSNNGKIIDMMNGFYFDFYLGFNNLNSVKITDTGSDKSKLTFDYSYNPNIILPNNTLVIDPVIDGQPGTIIRILDNSSTASTDCTAVTLARDTGVVTNNIRKETSASTTNPNCVISAFEFDVNFLPTDSVISDVDLIVDIDSVTSGINCDFSAMTTTPTTGTIGDIWTDILDNDYVSNDVSCATTGNNKNIDLGATADSDLDSAVANDETIFSVGMYYNSMTRDGSIHSLNLSDPRLAITYSVSSDIPNLVSYTVNPNDIDFSWVASDHNGGSGTITYTIRRSTNGASFSTLDTTTSTTYTDSTPLPQDLGYYRFISADSIGTAGKYNFPLSNTITSNIVGHFTFDHVLTDTGNQGQDLTEVGTLLFVQDYPTKTHNGVARYYDGASYDYVSGSDTPYDFERTDDHSFSFWIYPQSLATAQRIFEKRTTEGEGLTLRTDGKLDYFVDGNNIMEQITSTALSVNTLYFVVIVNDGTNANGGVDIYINNVASGISNFGTWPSTTILNNNPFTLGAIYGGTSPFIGYIDDFRYYNFGLNSTQADQLFYEYFDTSNYDIPPQAPTLTAQAENNAIRFYSTEGFVGDEPNIWYSLRCEENGTGGWLNTVTNSTMPDPRLYNYEILHDNSVTCQWRDGSIIGWGDWSNNATATSSDRILIQTPRLPNSDPLKTFEGWIDDMGGLYFGISLFPMVVMIIGFMATKSTVHIFTLISLMAMGIIHASGFYIYPDWYWAFSLLFGVVLVLGRRAKD